MADRRLGDGVYQSKLMVLHAVQDRNKLDFTSEVSMAKALVANILWRIIDRSIQVTARSATRPYAIRGCSRRRLEPLWRWCRRDP